MAVDVIEQNLDGSDLSIGVVVSRFNEYAGKELYAACLEELKRLGVAEEDITYVTVPGALEIPFALSRLAETGDYDALIALDFHGTLRAVLALHRGTGLALFVVFRRPRRRMRSDARRLRSLR